MIIDTSKTTTAAVIPAVDVAPATAPAKQPGLFARYRREAGMILGILLCAAVWLMPAQPGLKPQGQHCLALGLLAVTWWAMGVAHPGFTALVLLGGYVLTKTGEPAVVFRLWTMPLVYLIVGGFLIAAAVEGSGLGKRIAYHFILRFVRSFRGVLASAYVLGFLLSFMIPQPWPRSFLIMAVLGIIVRTTNLPPKHSASVGLAVFAGSVPTSMVLLTGDSTLNVLAMGLAGRDPSWLVWLLYMGVPGAIACALIFCLHLLLFKGPEQFAFDKENIREQLLKLGPMGAKEKATLIWVLLAIGVWATDSLHKVNPGWVALACAVGLSLPRIGDVLKPADWGKVNVGTLFFLTAAMAIGGVGGATGMNAWVASLLLPAHAPSNVFLFALLAAGVTVAIHCTLGSATAAMSFVTPTLIAYGATVGLNPLVPALLVYTASYMHFLLPFHQMSILVGLGESGGTYRDSDVLRLGIPLTVVVFIITVAIEVPWWYLVGLIK